MVDEKTNEIRQEKQSSALPNKTRREKLRSLWARTQCRNLLRRHRFRRKTQHHMNRFSMKLRAIPLLLTLGEVFYSLGFAAEYRAVRIGRSVRNTIRNTAHIIKQFWHDLAVIAFPGAAQFVKDIFEPIYRFLRGTCTLLVHAHRVRKKQGFGAAVQASIHYLKNGIQQNIQLLPRMAMYLLPLAAFAVLVTVYNGTITQPYALAVQVNGQTVGYVANENVFNSAREDVQQRINYAGTEKTEWTIKPTYTLSVASHVLDENEMANAILMNSSDEISEGTALYLDDQLTAVCSNGDALRSYIEGLLEPYEDTNEPNTTVGFNKQVTLEDGIYFNESFEDYNNIESMLSGVQQAEKTYTVQTGDTLWAIAQKNNLTFRELCALNPSFKGEQLTENSNIQVGDQLIVTKKEAMLEVRITKIEIKQEEIPYSTETTQSNEYTKGTTKTLQEGENGLRNVTMKNVYDTDGNLLEQSVLSTETVKEPVNKKVVVGTKKVTNSTQYITGSGQFIWPVPSYRYCSRWYSSGHKGVDICAPAGTPIYATAAGTVTKAGYERAGAGRGYGYSVIISHSGGYSSVYAHCLSLVVSAGQTVRQGQLLGYVGSTGNSSGNHCHFEIRRNGSYIPPQNIFSGKK